MSTTVHGAPRRSKSGLFGRRRAGITAAPEPTADTQVIEPVDLAGAEPETPITPVMHHTTDPTQVVHNMLVVLSDGLKHNWSATRFTDALRVHFGELNKRAGFELLTAQTEDRRRAANGTAAEANGTILDDAGRRGEDIGPESERGRAAIDDIVGRARRVGDPRPTGLIPRITADMPDPREAEAQPAALERVEQTADHVTFVVAPPSPVHDDGTLPPVPAAPDEGADPAEPLPHRKAAGR